MQVFTDHEGNEIRLTDERLRHIQRRHPEVFDIHNAIADTLANPDVLEDYEGQDDTINYSKWYAGIHMGRWVVVGVAITEYENDHPTLSL